MQEEWNALVETFEKKADLLGRPIDPDIFETVVVLNALGITTTMSCGGHIDDGRGLLLPWVDIAATGPEVKLLHASMNKQYDEADALQLEVARLREEQASQEIIKAAQSREEASYIERLSTQKQIRLLQCKIRNKLIHYLTTFYNDRVVLFDQRLVLHAWTMKTRLESQGAGDFYLDAPLDVQRQKLLEYREEMQAFTAFLKAIYFSQQAQKPEIAYASMEYAR